MALRELRPTWYVTYILNLLNRDGHDECTSWHRWGEGHESDVKKKKKKKHWQFPAHIFDLVEHYESVLKTRSCVLKLIY